MAIEKTVSELAEILGVSRQAINNRVKALPPEDTEKNEKGVTVVTRSGLIKLEEIYKKTIFEDEPVSEEVKQLAKKDEQLRVKDVQIAEKDKQLDQQQQLTAKAMSERETLLLELDEAKEKVQKQENKGFFARLFGK